MPKKILSVIIMLAFMFSFTGCKNHKIETDVTKLMGPPTLSDEQAEIHALLEEHVSTKLKLKYPKNGEHRSAFIFKDLDGDGSDEVIAFFEFTDMGKSQVRIALLDQNEKGWYFVKDIPGGGSDIESVSFERFYDNTIHILVGYSESGRNLLHSYIYKNGDFRKNLSTEYSSYKMISSNDGTYNQLAIIKDVWAKKEMDFEIVEQIIDGDSNTLEVTKSQVLPFGGRSGGRNSGYEIYQDIDKGKNKSFIYIDCYLGDINSAYTHILMLTDDKTIENVKAVNGSDAWTYTLRNEPIPTMDIDENETLETPVFDSNKEIANIENKKHRTDISLYYWYNIEDDVFSKKYISVYNNHYKYFYIMPASWEGKVNLSVSDNRDELIVTKKAEEGQEPEELIRVLAVPVINNLHISEEYRFVQKNDEYAFYVKSANSIGKDEEKEEIFKDWSDQSV